MEDFTQKFTKEQLLASKKYMLRRDLLGVLLQDGVSYSIEEVEEILGEFMFRKV